MATRKPKPSAKPKPTAPTADEVPVTRAMLSGVRTELLQRIDQAREEAKADNQRLDGKLDLVRAELKAEIHEVKAEIHEIKAGLARVEAGMARMVVLFEEQNARNKIVLDALTAVLSRQDQVEQRVTVVEDTVRRLAAGVVRPAG